VLPGSALLLASALVGIELLGEIMELVELLVELLQIVRFSDRVRGVQASAMPQKNQKTRLK
jgi:hypothetical protein